MGKNYAETSAKYQQTEKKFSSERDYDKAASKLNMNNGGRWGGTLIWGLGTG